MAPLYVDHTVYIGLERLADSDARDWSRGSGLGTAGGADREVPRHHGLEGGAEELVLVGGDHVALEGHAVRAPRLSRRARPVVETGWRGERELS